MKKTKPMTLDKMFKRMFETATATACPEATGTAPSEHANSMDLDLSATESDSTKPGQAQPVKSTHSGPSYPDIATAASGELEAKWKWSILKDTWTDCHMFNFPSRSIHGKMRKLSSSWLTDHPWLRYSISTDALFCAPCFVFGRKDAKEKTFISTPVKDWSNLAKYVKRHELAESNHHNAVDCDLLEATRESQTLIRQFQNERADPNVWEALFQSAKDIAAEFEIEPSMPRLAQRQRNRANPPANDPQQYWQRALYFPFLDHLCQELSDRLIVAEERFRAQYLIPSKLNLCTDGMVDLIFAGYSVDLPQGNQSFHNEGENLPEVDDADRAHDRTCPDALAVNRQDEPQKDPFNLLGFDALTGSPSRTWSMFEVACSSGEADLDDIEGTETKVDIREDTKDMPFCDMFANSCTKEPSSTGKRKVHL
ncbi:hypothetical protein MAR_014975 [Mya arenaria]|uniref:TTF-type domain-containing protein n=1 Tax=Mya arenaria TaxID=6604 RepID=A0ABY7FJ97_MYAAR|nr:hypothetical protein MAR_014975 [Mya arenaria]